MLSPIIFVGLPSEVKTAYILGMEVYSMDRIIDSVCSFFSITRAELLGPSRKYPIKEPRNICIYLIRELVQGITFQEIANKFHRDHSTIMSSSRVVKNLMDFDKRYKRKVLTIKINL